MPLKNKGEGAGVGQATIPPHWSDTCEQRGGRKDWLWEHQTTGQFWESLSQNNGQGPSSSCPLTGPVLTHPLCSVIGWEKTDVSMSSVSTGAAAGHSRPAMFHTAAVLKGDLNGAFPRPTSCFTKISFALYNTLSRHYESYTRPRPCSTNNFPPPKSQSQALLLSDIPV